MLPSHSGTASDASAGPEINKVCWLKLASLAVYLLALLAIIPSPAKFHSDEQFYLDADIQMVQTGDYWTPYYPNGRIRLLKPILTYWASAGSMQVFGINLFAARLPFALAGVLTVFLTYQLARTLAKDERTALLAALIMASNVQLMTLSTRATPDALVCLFVLTSMWGLARIWFSGDQTFIGPLLVYGGMGLAVQTKGLLGLCPAGAAVLFWVLARPDASQTRRLLHWPAIITGLIVGSFWYALMLQRHGPGCFHDFFSDQVSAKVAYNPLSIVANLLSSALAPLRHFLPWTLLLFLALIAYRREFAGFFQQRRRECLFLLSLYVILVFAFSFASEMRARYLVAAYPMLAVFLAATLAPATFRSGYFPLFGVVLRIAAILILLLGAGLLIGGWGGDWRLVIGGGIFVAVGIAGFLSVRSATEFNRWIWVASTSVAVFLVVGACIRPALSLSPASGAVASLRHLHIANIPVHTWQTPGPIDAQLRVLSGGEIKVKALDALKPDFSIAALLMTTSEQQTQLVSMGYQLTPIIVTNDSLGRSWLGQAIEKFPAKSRKKPDQTLWLGVKIDTAQ